MLLPLLLALALALQGFPAALSGGGGCAHCETAAHGSHFHGDGGDGCKGGHCHRKESVSAASQCHRSSLPLRCELHAAGCARHGSLALLHAVGGPMVTPVRTVADSPEPSFPLSIRTIPPFEAPLISPPEPPPEIPASR